MTSIVGIAGSLRTYSFNRALLNAAADSAPTGVNFTKLPIEAVPLYDGDVESATGLPDAVRALNAAIDAADGLMIFTPEYNASIPGVMKNVIDWLSRPDGDRPNVLAGKRVALLGASPSSFGTLLSQTAWLPVLRTLRMRLWVENGPFYVPGAGKLIEDGVIVDADLKTRLANYVAAFASFLDGGG